MKITMKINGMSCSHCKMSVERALGSLAGVKKVTVSLPFKKATIETEGDLSDALLRDTVADAGYEVAEIKR